MKQKGLTGELMAELFGTFILVLLGDGVVAQVGLAARLDSAAYDWNTICWGWGFAVLIAVYVAGGVSGAHINPAVTIALAVKRDFPWSKVGPYIGAQLVGAFIGALGVYLVYLEGLQAAGMPNVWSTGPGALFGTSFWGAAGSAGTSTGSYSLLNASLAEFFGTMVLLWGVLASGDDKNLGLKNNMGPFLVAFTVVAVGLSLGGPSGYSINPARDLGPRIFGAIVGTKDLFNGIYWLIPPVLIPAISGAIGIFLYDWFISPALADK